MRPLELLARKITLEMIFETGSAKEAIALAALEGVAKRCAELCMERCRDFNREATAFTKVGRHEKAADSERLADQFSIMERVILREFQLPQEDAK